MDLCMGISFNVVFLCFVCLFTGVVCQLGNTGLCFEEFHVHMNNTLNQANVLFVCTDSTTLTYTNVVYLDTAKVPLQDTSECSCRIMFKHNKRNDVQLELKIRNKAGNNLTVQGFGTTISRDKPQTNAATTTQENPLTFSLITGVQSLEACLRIMEFGQTNSSFQAACFQRGSGRQVSDENPTTVLEENPEEVTSETNPETGAIIGGSVGGAVLVVLVITVIVVLIKRRKRTTTQKEEDYYMVENSMYNKPTETPQNLSDLPPVTNDYQLTDDYDIIQSANQNKDGADYSVADKSKAISNIPLDTQQNTQENEYNHLNEIPAVAATGNVYSSTANRNIESNPDDFYNCTTKNSTQSKITENVYDTST